MSSNIHGGIVLDSVINIMDKFAPEILVIQFGFLVILSTIFLWLWFANRKKYHNLKHAIPANVVKSYLDSIIQNSTSLKSQLFRGGGLDVKNGIPSVMSLNDLIGDGSVALSGSPSTELLEELNSKKAQIALLESQNSALQNAQQELEHKLGQSQNVIIAADEKITELERIIETLKAARGSENPSEMEETLKLELTTLTKERDELKESLKEYSMIEDDLASLKKLKEENKQLKISLSLKEDEAQKTEEKEEIEAAPMTADVSDLLEEISDSEDSNADTSALEEFLSAPLDAPIDGTTREEVKVSAKDSSNEPEDENKSKSDKTPDDLLSEFEKMLG